MSNHPITPPPEPDEPGPAPQVKTVRDAKRIWKQALEERQRRAEALEEAVRESTGVEVPAYSVASVAEISLFPGLANDRSNGNLASAAKSVLHPSKAKPSGP